MIKNNKFAILTYIFTLIFLNSCQNFKDGLSLKKKTNTDEFLVQKKNPLVLPPDYKNIPQPGKKNSIDQSDQKIKKILTVEEEVKTNQNSSSVEESILQRIGQ